MSGIVLSASVRQNLLSLQSTAALLSTTQNRLATGNKVNTALDNPTNYFTAQGLSNRASDISSLLDGIGNGVQVLQAANTGITSLQQLVDTAKSIANQVLQTTVGYSPKSTVTSSVALPGNAANLVDQYTNVIAQITTTAQDASFNGINLLNGDDLKLTFDETSKSTLTLSGVTYTAPGLGLTTLVAGTNFLDNSSANATMAKLT